MPVQGNFDIGNFIVQAKGKCKERNGARSVQRQGERGEEKLLLLCAVPEVAEYTSPPHALRPRLFCTRPLSPLKLLRTSVGWLHSWNWFSDERANIG